MIAGLSKAVTLYLSPVLMLTAILLSLFAYLAPVLILRDRVALLIITPSTGADGPSLFLGPLGSCSRSHNAGSISCTAPTISPTYDLSALPDQSSLSLTAPTPSAPAFMAVALSFSIIFFLSFTLISFRHKLGGLSAILEKPLVQRLSAWIGFFGFLIGITSFLVVRMWFGKAMGDFNAIIEAQGQQRPRLVGSAGNGFTMVWVAYAFYAVPLIVSLSKLNIAASKSA